jgi:hypothetical protein
MGNLRIGHHVDRADANCDQARGLRWYEAKTVSLRVNDGNF